MNYPSLIKSMLRLAILFVALACSSMSSQASIVLRSGQVIDRNTSVTRRLYSFLNPDDSGATAAITIRGSDITVDFNGAILQGSPQTAEPDKRSGTGVRVEGKNITLKNLRVKGYKIGLIVVDSPGIKIVNCDLSYNWKQRLASTLDREDESDWMSYHQNEKDEWLGYGAGIYLRRCDGFEVKGVTIHGGQCGLMLMECNNGTAYNNDFSFLSGIGLGMYRSSKNRIMHNRIDWCVRGYSHGVYNRGQDSAGILIYEQSSGNVFAYNSVTHGGDGFFLWAGQTTMDTGTGGCNDNLVYGNDFSHAPTNGIEATFSRNTFAGNLVMECWHGVWGGYSYDTRILDNVFAYNAESVSIEHGQHNEITGNLFLREGNAIHVWQDQTQDSNWGYPRHHDTLSHDYTVSHNLFSQIASGGPGGDSGGSALVLKATSDFRFVDNLFGPVSTLYDVRGPLTNFVFHGAPDPKAHSSTTENPRGSKRSLSPPNGWNRSIPSLGNGWGSDQEGRAVASGLLEGLLAPIMHSSGNPIMPYPEGQSGYSGRFHTNWDPLKLSPGGAISVGRLQQGKNLMEISQASSLAPAPVEDGIDPFLHNTAFRGRSYILVDHWGPYDFKSPIIWPRKGPSIGDGLAQTNGAERDAELFELLGPKGRWTAARVTGGELSASSGTVPGFVQFKRSKQGAGRVAIELTYSGGKTVDYRGIETPAGRPVAFRYTEFCVPVNWHIGFFKYDKSTQEPRTMPGPFRALISGKPNAEMIANSLDLAPGRAPANVGNDYFATVSDGDFEMDAGDYLIDITTDDGARLYLDGKLLVDEWKYQGPTTYTREVHLGGKHHLRVEHFQIDGYWTLKVAIREKQ